MVTVVVFDLQFIMVTTTGLHAILQKIGNSYKNDHNQAKIKKLLFWGGDPFDLLLLNNH